MIRVVVTGAGGRMGETTITTARDRSDTTVVGAVNRSPVGDDTGERGAASATTSGGAADEYGGVAGVSVRPATALADLLGEREPSVVVDFTAPPATVSYAQACAAAGVAFVTGTTGLDADDRAALAEAAESIPVLRASNFSRGIAALRRAVRAAVGALPGYDVEVTETHHDGKRDAPSGTAETLLEDVTSVRPELDERRHGRVGDAPRESGEIGVHARRAGDIAGEHEVLLAGDDQTVTLTHRAGSRRVFAAGALDAAAWVAGRPPDRYDFADVLDGESAPAASDPSETNRDESGADDTTEER